MLVIMPLRGRLRRAVTHEWTVAGFGSALAAVIVLWVAPGIAVRVLSAGAERPAMGNPRTTIFGDIGDPTAQAWILAWNGHALRHEPSALWRTNAFFPEAYGLAFSDSLLGYAPAGLLGSGIEAAVLRYHVVLVLAFALASYGTYLLARQLGASRVAGALAGAAFAYAPWRYGHDGHLNILSSGGIPLALAMLARAHGWSPGRPRGGRTRWGWALAGWCVAAWQISLGFGIGLFFVYVLASMSIALVARWVVRGTVDRRLVAAHLGGAAVFALVCGYLAMKYIQVRAAFPDIRRSWDYVAVFSPSPRSFVTAPDSSLLWGGWHETARQALEPASSEKVLLCGFLVCTLAAVGLFWSVWPLALRLWASTGVAVGTALCLGTNGFAYGLLYEHVPGFDGSRTPGRLILWPTLLLALLAAGLVTHVQRRMRQVVAPRYARRVALGVACAGLAGVLVEGLPLPDHPEVPAPPAAMASAPSPMIVLPSDEGVDLNVMLWSTEGFPRIVNGGSGYSTPGHDAIREVMKSFPSDESIAQLRTLGIRSVVIDRARVLGTDYEPALHAQVAPGQGITRREVGGDVVFHIDEGPSGSGGGPQPMASTATAVR